MLTAATTAIAAAPAQADVPASQLSVSPSTVHPGDTVTITQTLTNNVLSTLLSPVAQLTSAPGGLTSFTSLMSCAGAVSCGVANNSSGQPIGYQAILPSSLPLGGNGVVSYTLQILPTAPDLQETLQGRLLGSSFLSDLLSGPTLIVDANADVAVSVAATPKLGVLSPTLDVAVTVTNNGPGQFLLGTITTTIPAGLIPVGVPPCVGVPGVGIPGQVICVVPLLAKGASTTLRFSIPLNLLTIGLPYTFTSSRTLSFRVCWCSVRSLQFPSPWPVLHRPRTACVTAQQEADLPLRLASVRSPTTRGSQAILTLVARVSTMVVGSTCP
jgi:hypothetical protein